MKWELPPARAPALPNHHSVRRFYCPQILCMFVQKPSISLNVVFLFCSSQKSKRRKMETDTPNVLSERHMHTHSGRMAHQPPSKKRRKIMELELDFARKTSMWHFVCVGFFFIHSHTRMLPLLLALLNCVASCIHLFTLDFRFKIRRINF